MQIGIQLIYIKALNVMSVLHEIEIVWKSSENYVFINTDLISTTCSRTICKL